MSPLLDHHLCSRRRLFQGQHFSPFLFIAAVFNINICIEYLNSHSATSWASQATQQVKYQVFISHSQGKKCLYMKNGLSAIYSFRKERNQFEHLGYRCNMKLDLSQELCIATTGTINHYQRLAVRNLVGFITYL